MNHHRGIIETCVDMTLHPQKAAEQNRLLSSEDNINTPPESHESKGQGSFHPAASNTSFGIFLEGPLVVKD